MEFPDLFELCSRCLGGSTVTGPSIPLDTACRAGAPDICFFIGAASSEASNWEPGTIDQVVGRGMREVSRVLVYAGR